MPTFTVVTPSLDQGQFLGDCLASVRVSAGLANAQVQHVVIDGGSSDGTVQILKSRADIEWESGPDRGQTDAINKGVMRATGDVVSYLCADDLIEEDAFRLVGDAFSANENIDVVYGDAFFLEGGWRRRKNAGKFSFSRLRRGNFLFQPAVFFRRRVIERFGRFQEELRFCMDHEYWLRIGGSTVWHYIPEPLASSRLHPDAKTWKQLVPAWDEARRMQAGYGIFWRPLRDAWWMRIAGCHFYRIKRNIIATMARRRAL